ncbi:hypothetical protein PG987_004684 [Apiospora arundinis]|uniref:NADH-ubiquinone oxidoreductase 19.3 kDa subunit mitochondrial n=1 Tax=Apiospora arundinis TaxID=335852 RepID=A0ABR2J5C3_9PEZI
MLRWWLRQQLPSRLFTRRRYGTNAPHGDIWSEYPVRVLGPTIWCTTAIGASYLGCAAYEVYQDVQDLKTRRSHSGWLGGNPSSSLTFDQLEAVRATSHVRNLHRYREPQRQQRAMDVWYPAWLAESSAAVRTAIGVNAGIYVLNSLIPSTLFHFAHVAAERRNYTLFTSMFGHSGLMHLGFNMYALTQFAPHVQQNRIFQGSNSHFAAFYLSSGLAASLGQHLSTVWPKPAHRLTAGLGASGAIMAILASFAMSNPRAEIGIMFVPGSLPAQQALLALTAFELYGLFVGIRWLPLGHAAHLTGLAVGAAYVQFDGRKHLWTPARRLAFNSMQRFEMI